LLNIETNLELFYLRCVFQRENTYPKTEGVILGDLEGTVTAGERGKEVEHPSRLWHSPKIARPGDIEVSIHRTESFDPEFMRQSLMKIFNKTIQDAQIIVRTVELAGSANCGTFSRQVAETKVDEVRSAALRRQTRIDMRLSRNDLSINKAN
jgi:ATP-dependent Clp protease adapter protein ClpS